MIKEFFKELIPKLLRHLLIVSLGYVFRQNINDVITIEVLFTLSLGVCQFKGPGGVDLDNPSSVTGLNQNITTPYDPLIIIPDSVYLQHVPRLDISSAERFHHHTQRGYNVERITELSAYVFQNSNTRSGSWDYAFTNHPITGECKPWDKIYDRTSTGNYTYRYTIKRAIQNHNRLVPR